MDTDDFRRFKIDRLTQHAGLSLNAANAPADDAEAIDHGGVRVRADEGVGVEEILFIKYDSSQVLQIYLVYDSNSWGHNAESFKCLLTPFEELIALTIALKFDL